MLNAYTNSTRWNRSETASLEAKILIGEQDLQETRFYDWNVRGVAFRTWPLWAPYRYHNSIIIISIIIIIVTLLRPLLRDSSAIRFLVLLCFSVCFVSCALPFGWRVESSLSLSRTPPSFSGRNALNTKETRPFAHLSPICSIRKFYNKKTPLF